MERVGMHCDMWTVQLAVWTVKCRVGSVKCAM